MCFRDAMTFSESSETENQFVAGWGLMYNLENRRGLLGISSDLKDLWPNRSVLNLADLYVNLDRRFMCYKLAKLTSDQRSKGHGPTVSLKPLSSGKGILPVPRDPWPRLPSNSPPYPPPSNWAPSHCADQVSVLLFPLWTYIFLSFCKRGPILISRKQLQALNSPLPFILAAKHS